MEILVGRNSSSLPENKNNMTVKIINFGGIITSLLVPDLTGKIDDVVLGYKNLDDYLTDQFYLGTLIGRFGNRIAKGHFVLNGKEYQLARNDGENHLHGGNVGFNRVVWEADEFSNGQGVGGN